MNIVGKILVILILVFAVTTGGFLLVDFATRTNWKKYADGLKDEMEIAKANQEVAKKTWSDLDSQVRKAIAALEVEKQSRKNDKIVRDIQLADADRRARDEALLASKERLTAQTALKGVERLTEENKALAKVIEAREQKVLTMEDENRKLRMDAVNFERKFQAANERSLTLLEQLRSLNQELAKAKTGPGKAISTDPTSLNPPPAYVKGVIEKVDKDGYVEISIGSDQGLKKYHTLEVFRLNPGPKYLGTLRIVEAYNRKAIGRMMPTPLASARGALQKGDQVASSLTPR